MKSEVIILTFLLVLSSFYTPLLARSAELININTATLAELDSLPGVGATIAQRIIDGRPYTSTAQIQNVEGIGGPGTKTYDDIIGLITIGSTPQQNEQEEQEEDEQEEEEDTSATQTDTSADSGSGGASSTLGDAAIHVGGTLVARAGTTFNAEVVGSKKELLTFGVRYLWNFGDGSTGGEAEARHVYEFPGTYVVQLTASYRGKSATARTTVTIVAPDLSLAAPGDGSLALRNNTSGEVDLGWFSLKDTGSSFIIPNGTVLLPGQTLKFSPKVTGLAGSVGAALYFPTGALAAYASAPAAKTPAPLARASSAPTSGSVSMQRFNEPLPVPGEVALVHESNQPAAALESHPSSSWLPFAGLLTLLLVAGAGTYYMRRSAAQPASLADEFKIE